MRNKNFTIFSHFFRPIFLIFTEISSFSPVFPHFFFIFLILLVFSSFFLYFPHFFFFPSFFPHIIFSSQFSQKYFPIFNCFPWMQILGSDTFCNSGKDATLIVTPGKPLLRTEVPGEVWSREASLPMNKSS